MEIIGLLVGAIVVIGIAGWTTGFVRAARIAPVKERLAAYGAWQHPR